MKAIVTTLYGAHRVQATDNDGTTVRIDRASELQYEQQHDAAARALCQRMDWHGTLIKAQLMRHGVNVGRIYVWTDRADTLTV